MATISGLSAGTYNDLTITVAGCTSTENVDLTLTDPATPTLAATPNDPTTCTGSDGSIDLTLTNVADGTYTIDYMDGVPSAQTFTNVTVTGGLATISGLSAGTYNDLTITVAGCTSTENVDLTLTDPATPTLAATPNDPTTCTGSDGSIDLTLTNVADGTYTIDYMDGVPSAQTFTNVTVTGGLATISGLSAGTYNDLTITVAGCTSTENVDLTLTDPATPTLAATPNDPTTCTGSDGSIDLTLTNVADGTYTIDYMDGVPSAQTFTNVTVTGGLATISGLSAGTYNDLTITVAGCTSTENVDLTLTDPATPTLAATPNDPTTCTGSDGSIDLTLTNVADGTYTINYMDGVPSAQTFTNVTVTGGLATISGLSAGTYNDLTITVAGCTSTENVDLTLTDPATPTLAATPNDPTTCTASDGSIDLTLTNVADGTYTIDYMDGVPSAQTFTNVTVTGGLATISGLSAGTYNDLTITVAGCTSTENVDLTLTDPATPTLAATPNDPTTCTGSDGSIDLTLTNVADGTYTIDYMDGVPSAQTFTNVTVTGGLATISGLSAGTYNDLTITVAGCTSTENVDLTLTDPATPTLAATPNDPTTCTGSDGSIDLTLTNVADGTYTIDYMDGVPSAQTFTNVTVTGGLATISGLSAGTYNDLTITVAGCTSTENVDLTLTDPATPTLAATPNDPTTCTGSDGSIDLTLTNVADGTYTINYMDGVPSAQTFTNVTVTGGLATISGLSAGTYNDLTITVAGCTSTENVDLTLTDPATPTLAATPNDPTTCTGSDGSIDLTLTNVADGTYTINYMDGVPSAQTFTNVTVTGGLATISGLSAGTYNDLTITVAGCTSTENVDLTLTDPATPTLAATPNDPTTCTASDGSIDLTLTNVADGTYTIDYMDGVPSAQTFTNVTVTGGLATISGLSAGTYNDLTITVAGCTSTENVDLTLTDPATPTLAATPNDPTTCTGSDGSIDLTLTNVADGTYTIDYMDGVPSAQTFTNVTVTGGLATISGLSAGTYNDLTITVAGCTSTENVDLTLTDPATPTLAATPNDPTTCTGSDGSIDLTLTNVADGTYTIDYMDGVPSAQTFTNVTVTGGLATISGLSAGTYNDLTITVVGCTSTENVDLTLTDPATPTLAATPNDPTTCTGSDGSIDLTLTNVADGTYTINYMDGVPSAQTFTNVTVTGGLATISGLSAGTYNDLTITVAGCTSTENVDLTLTDPATPTLAATPNDPTTCTGSDGSIDLTLTNVADGTYTINYMDGVPSAQTFTNVTVTGGLATISGLSAGMYNDLTITVAGCTSTENVDLTLTDPETPTLAATPNDPTTCTGSNGSIDLTLTNVADGTYTIDYMDGVPSAQTFTNVTVTGGLATISGLSAGTYNDLTITVAGCTSTENVDLTLTDPATPTLAATPNDPTTCTGSDGSIDLTLTNVADGTYTINYMDGVPSAQTFTNVTVTGGLATISGLSAGTYNDLTITVAGCTSTENVDLTLTDPATPTLAATPNDPTTCTGSDGSIDLTLTNVADGTYTIDYMDGVPSAQTFTNVTVTGGLATISGLSAGTYNDLTITVAGCTSTENVDLTLTDPATPTLAATPNDPTTCTASDGSIDLTLTNVADGTYTINYMDGVPSAQTFTNVTVTGGLATISGLSAGTYNDLTITVAGCTSTEEVDMVLNAPDVPPLTITALAVCADETGNQVSINTYYVEVSAITGGNGGPYAVTVDGTTLSFDGTASIFFGPFNHSGVGGAVQVVTATDNGASATSCEATGSYEVPEALCGINNGGQDSGCFCVGPTTDPLVSTSFIVAQSQPGTFQAGGNTGQIQQYLLVNEARNIVAMNLTGLFEITMPGTYTPYAINYPVDEDATIMPFLAVGQPIQPLLDGISGTGPLAGVCYMTCNVVNTVSYESCPCYSVGSTIFADDNNDGQFDFGGDEVGLANITIQLIDSNGDVIATTDTDDNGDYYFGGLYPGMYSLNIPSPPTLLPASSFPTDVADNGEDNDDNGIQAAPGEPVTSPVFELGGALPEPSGADETSTGGTQDDAADAFGDMTQDFGFFTGAVTVGDTTFVDIDMDGTQSTGDLPLANVTVTIYDQATGATVTTDAVGMPYTATKTTDATGAYLFENLPPGNYYLEFNIGTAPDAVYYDFTTPNQGTDDAIDSDAAPANATDDVANSTPTGPLAIGESDLSLDAGVVCAVEVTVAAPFAICGTASIDLRTNASVAPAVLGGNWTSDGTGQFLDAAGDPITSAPNALGAAVNYLPSDADKRRGFVTLTLTSNTPPVLSGCEPQSSSVRVEIMKVDCGGFFWDGQ